MEMASLQIVISLLLVCVSSTGNDTKALNTLKENWTKFIKNTLTPNMTCYKSVADYGTIKVGTKGGKCSLTVSDEERELCIKLNTKAELCHAHVKRKHITITLIHAEKFCENGRAALHMLVHSTSPFARHGLSLPQTGSIPRHLFIDPVVRIGWLESSAFASVPGVHEAELTIEASDALPETLDYADRSDGGILLMDCTFTPMNMGYKMLVSAADPRYQAQVQVQWMTVDFDETLPSLTQPDAMYFGATTCREHRKKCAKSCSGHLDAQCECHKDIFPPQSCMASTPVAAGCDPAKGSRDLCPYGTTIGADIDPGHKATSCPYVSAVVNGLDSIHDNVKKFLASPNYPWPYFLVTILGCVGKGRLTDITIGFPKAYRQKLLKFSFPPNRVVLCDFVRVYIANAEAQVTASHNFLTHETFCLDDLLLASMVHLPRPRRPPPADGGIRDAVHLWLGRPPKINHVDLRQLVVKMYSVPASSKVLTPYKSILELHMEHESAGKCVVEVTGDNKTGTTPADGGATTESPVNFSMEASRMVDVRIASTGSALGVLFLLVLFTYCMCQHGTTGDWESQSSWSQSPGSWTTSSSSSFTDTPISSDEYYSSDSFDFERDAHLVRSKAALKYMLQVQEEAVRKRKGAETGEKD